MQPEDRHPARAWLLRATAAVVLLIVLLALSVRLFPTLIAQGRDSGIFAYTGWAVSEGAVIYRDVWENKPPGIYFVNALAFMAHQEDHHPDLGVHYDRCVVRYSTHDVGGLSENDFICAARADVLAG